MFQTFGLAFTAVFVALDIIGTLPLYAAMTRSLAPAERHRVVNVSMIVAFAVALVFLFVGAEVFKYLGIDVSDFKMAGGLVLLLISLAELVGTQEATDRASGSTGVVPLAVPLITGPAVLTSLFLQVKTAGYPITLAALVLNYFIAWAALRKTDRITSALGSDGIAVVSKIVALLLAAIAVSLIRSGTYEAIRGFSR